MPWYLYGAHFFGAAFLANSLPHLIAGVSGNRLPTPFASPPFRGFSSPSVNTVWALINLAAAYLLLVRPNTVDLRNWTDAVVCFAGFGLMAFFVAGSLTRIRAQNAS